MLAISLFALAAMPLTVGFVAKFYLIGRPEPGPTPTKTSWPGHVTLAAVLVLLILFGVYPAPVVSWVGASVLPILP